MSDEQGEQLGTEENGSHVQEPMPSVWMAQQTQRMENKSQMLEEVNQLVELMSAEKSRLTEKGSELEAKLREVMQRNTELEQKVAGCLGVKEQIDRLESEVAEKDTQISSLATSKASLESTNQQLQSECGSLQAQLKECQGKHSKNNSALQEVIARTRQELLEMEAKVEMLTASLDQEKANCQGYAELKQRHKRLQSEHKKTGAALEAQCTANVKLGSRLSLTQEQNRALHAEDCMLRSKVDGLQLKLRQSQEEVLALRGRLTSTRKSQEQLLARCSSLEKSANSPTIVKVSATRSKEELRLAAECMRKDELLVSYVRELSTAQQEQQRLEEEKCCLQTKLTDKQEEKNSLEASIKLKDKECEGLARRLQECEDRVYAQAEQECEFMTVQEDLKGRLCSIEEELRGAKVEVEGMRGRIEEGKCRGREEREKWEEERRQARALIKSSHEVIRQLRQELETTRMNYAVAMEKMNREWAERLKEAEGDYQRLKEVGTKRCAELAKEVWQLKARLDPNMSL